MDIPVRFRDCSCPGTPHDGVDGHDDGDIAYLRPYLDFVSGAEATAAFQEAAKTATYDADGDLEISAFNQHVGPVYLRRGVTSWNVVDENGPVPLTALAELRYEHAYVIAEQADNLYGEQVVAPFVLQAKASSRTGPITAGSPRRATPSRRTRKPSARS